MSNLLDEALIDAEALRETALKNAEALLLEKFSDQIKGAVETILEQDDLEDPMGDLEGEEDEEAENVPDIPLAGHEGSEMCPCPDNEETIEIDFDELEKQVGDIESEEMGSEDAAEELSAVAEDVEIDKELLKNLSESNEDVELEEDVLKQLAEVTEELEEDFFSDSAKEETAEAEEDAAEVTTASSAAPYEQGLEKESLEISEGEPDEVVEESLSVDIKPVKSGWSGTPQPMIELAEEELLAMLQDSEKREHHEAIVKALKALQESHGKLKVRLKKALNDNKEILSLSTQMKDKLQESNLANSKLLYTNKVLMSDSLNERQKSKIVEALSNAVSVEEAKVIFETLQSATGSTVKNKKPESLSEVMNKTTSTMIISRRKKHNKKHNDGEESLNESSLNRWKTLAGLNKTTR